MGRNDLIVTTWRRLGNPRVGTKELRDIQNLMRERFGEFAVQSPAAIARVLADAGADLHHPEVIEFDAEWRESQIEREAKKFQGLEQFSSDQPLSLKQAEALIGELERLRVRFERKGDREALARLRTMAVARRGAAQSLGKDRTSNDALRLEQTEVAEWLKVWIQTPTLFADWVELRRRSAEFKRNFAGGTS